MTCTYRKVNLDEKTTVNCNLTLVASASYSPILRYADQNCDVVNRILVGNKNDDPDRKVSAAFLISLAHAVQSYPLVWLIITNNS